MCACSQALKPPSLSPPSLGGGGPRRRRPGNPLQVCSLLSLLCLPSLWRPSPVAVRHSIVCFAGGKTTPPSTTGASRLSPSSDYRRSDLTISIPFSANYRRRTLIVSVVPSIVSFLFFTEPDLTLGGHHRITRPICSAKLSRLSGTRSLQNTDVALFGESNHRSQPSFPANPWSSSRATFSDPSDLGLASENSIPLPGFKPEEAFTNTIPDSKSEEEPLKPRALYSSFRSLDLDPDLPKSPMCPSRRWRLSLTAARRSKLLGRTASYSKMSFRPSSTKSLAYGSLYMALCNHAYFIHPGLCPKERPTLCFHSSVFYRDLYLLSPRFETFKSKSFTERSAPSLGERTSSLLAMDGSLDIDISTNSMTNRLKF